ncbi:uncharacterized protein LOC109708086 [Ananas comosus]|uniref:Uncharacterized protein LOC109708086 n=1 Tax=Ananas comosus TaxID=4615 RepID=A0A6P5EP55_ANACO|nr:uncharacterized protein LOC109708086 [Ananas comosus]
MGGCASKPNEVDGLAPQALPAEQTTPVDVTASPTEANTANAEEPLVDLSTPKAEETDSAPAAAAGEELAAELKAESSEEEAPKEGEEEKKAPAEEEAAKKVAEVVVDHPLASSEKEDSKSS